MANMAGSDKKEAGIEINSSNEDHEGNHELQDEQIQEGNSNENDELNSDDDDNENNDEDLDDDGKDKRNGDKVKMDDKKGKGKGNKINNQGRGIKGKNSNNRNGKRGGGSIRTRIRSDIDLDMFDDLEDGLLDNGNKNEKKFNVRGNGARKRDYIESDRRFDVLTDRLAAGDLGRDDYIAIVKALGNDNGEKTSKGGRKMAKKKGKHGTIVCYLLYLYLFFPFGVVFVFFVSLFLFVYYALLRMFLLLHGFLLYFT